MTTIKELYEWAISREVEDLPVGLQFQDEGGGYPGDTFSAFKPDCDISMHIKKSGTDRYVLLA